MKKRRHGRPTLRSVLAGVLLVTASTTTSPISAADVVRIDRTELGQQQGTNEEEASRKWNKGATAKKESHLREASGDELPSRTLLRQSIVGGTLTNGQEFPFFVEGNGCAGSLVAPDVVLAAGHCAPVRRYVLVGSYVFDSPENNTAQPRHTILGRAAVHPLFSSDTARYDYMLYGIEPVTYPNLKPIELNDNDDVPAPGENVTVIGYGLTSDNFTSTDRIRKATVTAMNTTACHNYWASTGNDRVFEPTMLCTAGSNPARGPCLGDSGGPLFDANLRQVGIVSWGAFPGCGVKPAVYSRVSTVIPWIRQTMCQLTTNASALSFPCPDLVCPLDSTIPGTPTAILPRVASMDTFHIWNEFKAVQLIQVPPAGTKLLPDSVQVVTVRATNASNHTVSCQWKVTVPPTTGVATFTFNVSKSAPRDSQLLMFDDGVSGSVFRIRTSLPNGTVRLRGGPTAYLVAVLDNNDTPVQSVVVLRKNETTRGVKLVTPVPITTDWKVTLRAVGITNIRNVTVEMQLIGQLAVPP